MKRICALFALVLIVGLCAYAADGPQADLFFGYSFMRYNSAQTVPAFTANGGVGTLGWNFTPHIAMEAELGGYHNGNINNHEFDTTTFSYVFGPRVSWDRRHTFDPYFHALFGGQDVSTSINVAKLPPVATPVTTTTSGRISHDRNHFAMAIGGGLDIKIAHGILLRPVQLDYFLTRFEAPNLNPANGPIGGPTSNRNQNNLRYAAGIAFNFGGAQ
jgi:opacity protein-like surface antigen